MSNRAWVTLATNDSYGLGALVLAHSLRRVSSAYPAVVLITPTVTEAMRERLRAVFAEVITVDVLDSQDAAHLAMLRRPELGITFTKIHCWNLTQYEKCVFLDADTLVVQNSDELFERDEISAAPDVGWPDCFNSGVFVFVPSADTFSRLITFAQERGSFDGGDQGLLNSFFSDWARGDINKHLPFLYNVTSAAFYSYLPALKQFGQDLKIIHFIGPAKPWLQRFNFETRTVDAPSHIQGLLQLWWDLFVNQVHTQLDVSMVEDEDEPELPPAHLPHDVSQSLYYEPVLDPESEFPWHRPDNQIVEESPERHIVMIGVNDPWEIYRGNIPPNTKEHGTPAPHSEVTVQNIEDTRKYAWDYQHQEHASPRNINAQSEQQEQYWPPQSTHHHEHHSHHDIYQHHSEQQQDYSQSYQHSEQHWSHVPQNDYSHSQQISHSYHGQSNDHHGHWHHEDQDNSHQDYQLENSHEQFHNHQSYHSDHHEQPSQSFDDRHTNERDIYSSNCNQHEPQYPRNDETNKHHEHHGHSHQVHNAYKHSDTHTHAHSVEVRHVHVQPERKRKRRPRGLRIDVANNTNGLMNGDLSETDSETFDEIIPRHPYDGFYLRHKATIDARGRKICTHEIPPTPSPTPSPPDSPTLEDYETAEENEPSGYEEQSGVAGNLARVVPGVSTFEALDDLSRRQGWEAGNIDYMGADSFEKIWAKISQTLSTPRISPPKQVSPPIEPSALAPEEVNVQETEPTNIAPPKQVSPPIGPSSPAPDKVKVQETEPINIIPPKQVSPPIEPSSLAPKEVKVQETEPTKEPASATAEVVKEAVVEASAPALPVVAPVEAAVVKDSIPTEEPAKVASAPVEVVAPVTTTAAAPTPAKVAEPVKIPVAAEAAVPTAVKVADPAEVPVTVVATEAAVPEPEQKTEVAPVKSVKKAAEAPKAPEAAPVSPASAAKAPASPAKESPAKTTVAPAATDSPPLAHTPSKEQAPAVPAAKSEERRKPAGKLQLQPPAAADPLPTPDSEAEDAASLAQSIIASELRTPAVHSPTPPACPAAPASLASPKGLTVAAPEVPTPPVGGVSLAQIGVKPKEKSTIAAQIESSVAAATETPADPPKKKLVKKVAKKEGAEAPVPPPRKKEKKPKEK